jgi:hypothetical protein
VHVKLLSLFMSLRQLETPMSSDKLTPNDESSITDFYDNRLKFN